MSHTVRVVAIAGSMRAESYNRRLLKAALQVLVRPGVEVDVVELRALNLPLYDGDLEEAEGLPEGAKELKRRLKAADGLLIASPEYNGSIPGTFKNALDWASRGSDDDAFEGKLAALMAASPGRMGGLRMVPHLRHVLTVLGVHLLPGQINVSQAHEAFNPDGSLSNNFFESQLIALMDTFVSELRMRAAQKEVSHVDATS
jgi:chromate reductase